MSINETLLSFHTHDEAVGASRVSNDKHSNSLPRALGKRSPVLDHNRNILGYQVPPLHALPKNNHNVGIVSDPC